MTLHPLMEGLILTVLLMACIVLVVAFGYLILMLVDELHRKWVHLRWKWRYP